MELKLSEWASVPPTGFPGAIEPPTGKKQAGWNNGEAPGAGHFNWIFQAIADAQNEITNVVTGLGGTPSSDLYQLLAAIQRQSVKAALAGFKFAKDVGTDLTLNAITRDPLTGRIKAVGATGTIVSGNGHNDFSIEPAADSYAGTFFDIVFDAVHGLFIAVGSLAALHTSPGNGVWTPVVTGTDDFNAIATDGAGHSIAVGDGNRIWSSSTGSSWVNRSANSAFALTPDIVSIAYGAGVFVCVTNKGDIQWSNDYGVTWNIAQALAGSVVTGPRVAYHHSTGFIYHYSTNLYQSNDGITWTQIHNAVPSSASNPGLAIAPYCWLIGVSTANTGCAVQGWYSDVAVNAPPDFRMDYLSGDSSIQRMLFVDGQLMAVGMIDRIFMGGVL